MFLPLSSGGGYELLLYQQGGCDQGFHKIPAPYKPSKIKALANQATGETSKTVHHEVKLIFFPSLHVSAMFAFLYQWYLLEKYINGAKELANKKHKYSKNRQLRTSEFPKLS